MEREREKEIESVCMSKRKRERGGTLCLIMWVKHKQMIGLVVKHI